MRKIIVLGTATLDIILNLKEKFNLGTKIDVNSVFFSLGGGALNAVTTFKNLKLDYLAYFRLGRDLIGKVILEKIKKEKIKSRIFFHQGESQFSVVVLIPNIERTIFVYRGASDHFNQKELNQVEKGEYYYLTTANTSVKVFSNFLNKIRKHANMIAINPSKKFLQSSGVEKVLKLVDIIFINYEEAQILLKEKDDPINLGKKIVKKINPKILVITLGEKGSITFFENKIFKAGIFKPKKFVDPTGAGDAFASAFFGCLVKSHKVNEETIKKAIIWGSANASSNIEKLGAQIGLLKLNEYQKYKNLDIKVIFY